MRPASLQSTGFTLRKALRVLVLPVLAVYLLVLVGLYFCQDAIILHPPVFQSGLFPFDVPSTLVKRDWAPGGQYAGIVVEPRKDPVKGTVVFYHGNNGTAETVGARGIAAAIAENGYRVVMVEYPGFGRRTGKPDMDKVLEGCLSTFQAARNAFSGPMIVAGESYGAGMAAQVAGRQGEDIQGLVLVVPWDSLLKVVQETVPAIPARYMLHRNYDSIAALANFRKPVVVAAAERDDIISPHHGQALAKAIPTSSFVMLKGVDHNRWFRDVDTARWRSFLEFASGETRDAR